MPILYGSPISPFVRKAAIALQEKNIAYDWQYTKPHDDQPDFREASPLGKIPAYRDEYVAISDSSVICQYLEKIHPSPALYPAESAAFAKALWWEEYFDDGLIAPMRAIFFNEWMYPLFGRPVDDKALADGLKRLPPMLDYLEARGPKQGWMVGDHLGIADISLAVGWWNMERTSFAPRMKDYPNLMEYVTRIRARASFQKAEQAAGQFAQQLEAKK